MNIFQSSEVILVLTETEATDLFRDLIALPKEVRSQSLRTLGLFLDTEARRAFIEKAYPQDPASSPTDTAGCA